MRRFSLGLILVLFPWVTPAVGAAEGTPTSHLPSFNLAVWVLDWLGISETGTPEMGPGLEPNGLNEPSLTGIGSSEEPNSLDGPPETEMGPGVEPNG